MKVDAWIMSVAADYPTMLPDTYLGVGSDDTKIPLANVWFRVARGETYIGDAEVRRLHDIYEAQGIGFYAVIVPVGNDWAAQRELALNVLRLPCRGIQFDVEPFAKYLGSEAGLQGWLLNVLEPVSQARGDKELCLTYDPRDHWLDDWDFGRAVGLVDSLAPMVYTAMYAASAWPYRFKEEWGDAVLAVRRARRQCPQDKLFRPILQTYMIDSADTIASFREAVRLDGYPSLFRRGTVPLETWSAIRAYQEAPPEEEPVSQVIQQGLTYLNRAEWGARTDIPRLGHPVPRTARTEAIIHHTVVIDSDATPNRWETRAEVETKMRQLQTIRPDLGLDVPYNFVAFLMADGSMIVCEGRGLDRTGAHTHAHNTSGVATAFQGNFQLPITVGSYMPHISRWLGWLKFDNGMTNLGSSHPPGSIAYGHRDLSSTSCPGANLYAIIPQLTFALDGREDEDVEPELEPDEEDVEMIFLLAVQGKPEVYAWRLGTKYAVHVDRPTFDAMKAGGIHVLKVSEAGIETLTLIE